MNTSDKLLAEWNRIWRKLDRQARKDRCVGDIVCGWDWRTLEVVMPKEYARLMEIRKEMRLLKSAGLLP